MGLGETLRVNNSQNYVFMKKSKIFSLIWFLPFIVIISQMIPVTLLIVFTFILLLIAFLYKQQILFLFGNILLGHIIWLYIYTLLALFVSGSALLIINRLGLIGYIIFFLFFCHKEKISNYIKVGKLKNIIHFPFIWKGIKEPIWRFTFIFSIACISITIVLFFRLYTFYLLPIGIVFSLLNTLLEEILWRGLILPSVLTFSTKKQALILTALSFGLYHISLGFPLWACMLFAIGGFYMAGLALQEEGILASCIMHFVVNLLFVAANLIF